MGPMSEDRHRPIDPCVATWTRLHPPACPVSRHAPKRLLLHVTLVASRSPAGSCGGWKAKPPDRSGGFVSVSFKTVLIKSISNLRARV
jgi:hypothetical protein